MSDTMKTAILRTAIFELQCISEIMDELGAHAEQVPTALVMWLGQQVARVADHVDEGAS
jgi:hypothetical protein